MAVINGQYKHPTSSQYSEGLRRLIDIALIVDPAQRCDIHQVRALLLEVASSKEKDPDASNGCS